MAKKQNLFIKLYNINSNPDFIEFRESHIRLTFTIITLIGLFIVASWHFIDHSIDINNKKSVLLLRISCIIFYISTLTFSYFHQNRKYLRFQLILGFYITVIYSAILSNLTGGLSSPYWFGMNFLLIAWLLFVPFSFLELLLHSVLFIAFYSGIILCESADNINWALFAKYNFIYLETLLMGSGIAFINNKRLASIFDNEQIIKESEIKYKNLINKATDGIIITQNGKFVLVNPSFCEMSGFSENELLGMGFFDLVSDEDRNYMIDIHSRRMKGESFPLIYNAKGIRKDKSILYMELNSTTITYNNEPAAFIILRDQSEKLKAEQALRESEEKYKALVEKANDGIVILQDGYVRFINQMMAKILGYDAEKMIDTPFLDYLADSEKQKISNFYKLRQQGKEIPAIYESILIDKWGNKKPVEFNNSIINFNGNVATQTYIRDISERKKTELLLKESEEKFRTLTSSAMDAILMINHLGQITYWNDASEKIFGYKAEEVLYKDLHGIITPKRLINEYRDKLMKFARNEISIPKQKALELTAIKKDGTEFFYELSLSSFIIKDKWNGVGILRDITNRLKTEEELKKSKEILQNINSDLEKKIEERTIQLTNTKTQLLRLQKENLQSQFEMLKNQVNPHFLFNSLNVLISLIKLEPDTAEKFTEQLSKVYRYVLENKEKDLVNLETEIDFLKAYVFLLEIRFMDKLKISIDIKDDKLLLQIPPIALQLLIENAIKHNTFSKKSPLIIEIFIDEENYLYVCNNLQIRENRIESTGIGLKNIENRYKYLTDKKLSYGIFDEKYIAKIPLL